MGSGIDFPRNALEQLRTIFGLGSKRTAMDVVFVSFDVEFISTYNPTHHNAYRRISQIGVSMLDARSFSQGNPACSLNTQHFAIGGHKRLTHTANKLYFGTSQHLDGGDDSVNKAILKLFHIPDERNPQNFRHIVLISHGLRQELLILRHRGIMFEEISTIVAKFDTTYLARDVFGLNFGLQNLLRTLQCPSEHFHNAGNDANFTL